MDKHGIISIIIGAVVGGTLGPITAKWFYKKIDQRKAAKANKKEK